MTTNSPELSTARRYFPDAVYVDLLQIKHEKSDKRPDLKPIIKSIEDFVKGEGRGITTSQLRNIFAKVKRENDANQLQLMRPLLAYTAARQGTQGAKVIIALLDDLIQKVEDKTQLEGFKTFMESIVAYHKFHYSK